MMTVRLIAHTPEPEKVVAAAAKLCYSDAHITERDAQMVTWLYKQTAFVPIMSQGTERAAMRR